MIDVVLIATLRPEVLDLCLASFSKYFFKRESLRLICNIDPIGESSSQAKVEEICKKYFACTIFRKPEIPNFSAAVFWCWSQVNSDIFFHLEEDWIMLSFVSMPDVLKIFLDKKVSGVRFALKRNERAGIRVGSLCFSNKFSLNPTVFRLTYIQKLLMAANFFEDPEKQFYFLTDQMACGGRLPIVFWGPPSGGPYVADIGKKWRKFHCFEKLSGDTSRRPSIRRAHSDLWLKVDSENIWLKMRNFLNYKFFMAWWNFRHRR